MATHMLNITFDFDDDKAKQIADQALENELQSIIKEIILDKIAPMGTGWYGKNIRDWDNFNANLDCHIESFLEEHKEDILDRAAQRLVEYARRTKAWKETVGKVIEETAQ